ncbi:helix-turn-helix domain-containing protein [Nonomuraea sp. SMC257]|uniref:Helix-turn-helix domain-containing protein n=1 Tax=Nonomuraea montanisoli TaxID=2741721 RepID=A0A7Y6M2V1_9ACTN|nr:helix-turn-helix transcriptional regulator [Nonomuraea montanisoli]NUW33063.1 helix-turn-helix domain-containing protein [Nonomuraea montanisoli]
MPRPERPLDAGDSPLLRFAADLRALRRKAGDPTYRRLARLAHYSAATLSEAAAGRRLPTLAVTLAYVRACGGDEAEWEERWRRISEEPAGPAPGGDDGASPYVGLASFQAEDAARFFGRERVTGELLRRVAEQRIVMVFGASGAGKSSLLRAGLLAALRQPGRPSDATSAHAASAVREPGRPSGATSGDATSGDATSARAGDRLWRALLFTPGAHPLEECAIHLARLSGGTPGPLRDELAAEPRALHRLARQLLGDEPPGPELVVIVDQFEEVFTLCHDEAERARFVDLLLTAARAGGSRCRLVLGVRADFYAHCTSHPALLEALREAHLPLGPMTADELRQAVVQPAARAGHIVEGALASRIVADAAGQPGALPLVSHALLETWHRRRGTTLTLAGYEAAGGLSQAVARTAEDAYTALDPGAAGARPADPAAPDRARRGHPGHQAPHPPPPARRRPRHGRRPGAPRPRPPGHPRPRQRRDQPRGPHPVLAPPARLADRGPRGPACPSPARRGDRGVGGARPRPGIPLPRDGPRPGPRVGRPPRRRADRT